MMFCNYRDKSEIGFATLSNHLNFSSSKQNDLRLAHHNEKNWIKSESEVTMSRDQSIFEILQTSFSLSGKQLKYSQRLSQIK